VGQGRKHPADPSPVEGDVELFPSHLTVVLDGAMRRFHYVWLRDNSWASEDRVAQSSERRLFTADIHEAVEPVSVGYDPDRGLDVRWDDGRACIYAPAWLRRHDYSDEPTRRARRFAPTLWSATASGPPRLGHAEVVGTTTAQLAYLDAIREFGAVIVTGVPSRDGEVERFAELFGPVRELAFARAHVGRAETPHRLPQLRVAALDPAAALPGQPDHRRGIEPRRRVGRDRRTTPDPPRALRRPDPRPGALSAVQ
jgi:gamma-butyrobetaine dioxygenase